MGQMGVFWVGGQQAFLSWGWRGESLPPLAKNSLNPPPPEKVPQVDSPHLRFIIPTLINNFHVITQ